MRSRSHFQILLALPEVVIPSQKVIRCVPHVSIDHLLQVVFIFRQVISFGQFSCCESHFLQDKNTFSTRDFGFNQHTSIEHDLKIHEHIVSNENEMMTQID